MLYTAVLIYKFAGLRLVNRLPFYRYISQNLYAKRVVTKHARVITTFQLRAWLYQTSKPLSLEAIQYIY